MVGVIVCVVIIRIFLSFILWGVWAINYDNTLNVFFFPYKKVYADFRRVYSKAGAMILTAVYVYMTYYVFLYELIAAFAIGAKMAFDFVFKERKSDS